MTTQLLYKILAIGALYLPQASQLQESIRWEQELMKLNEMRQLWQSQGIHDYSFLLDVHCFGCVWKYPANIFIKEDEVVSVLDPESGEPLREKKPDGTQGRSL